MPAQAFTMTMTSLQKWLALLISLSIAIMVFFYRGYISKTQKSNGFLNYNANSKEHNDRTDDVLHTRMSEDIYEPLKHNGRSSDAKHDPLKDHDRPNDVLYKQLNENDRPNSAILEPQKDNDRTNNAILEPLNYHDGREHYSIHEPTQHSGRTHDVVHQPVNYSTRANVAIHKPLTDNSSPGMVVTHQPLKDTVHSNVAIHKPLKDTGRSNVAIHKPLKDNNSPGRVVTHQPLKDTVQPNVAMHKPPKDTVQPNVAMHKPLKDTVQPNVAMHKPLKDTVQPNVAMHKPLKDTVHSNVAIHKPLTSNGRPNVATRKPLRQSWNRSKYRLTNDNPKGGDTGIDLRPRKSRQSSNITRVQIKFNTTMNSYPTSHVAHGVPSAGPKALTACTYSGHNTVNVNATGDFLLRLRTYNDAISQLRRKILVARPLVTPWRSIGANLTVLWGNRDDFLQCLSWHYEVFTVMLPWTPSGRNRKWTSRLDRSNVLVHDYYEWTATEPLCSWIRQRGFTKARWDAVYNRTCNTDADRSIAPTSLKPVYFHGKPVNVRDYWPNDGDAYPAHFYARPPGHVFYVHLARDAVVTEPGDIISGSLKFLPYSCSQDTTATPPRGWNRTVVYGELFVMTQFWGGAHFHKMIEGFPRIAPYLDFLRDNEHVLIHAAETGGYTAATLRFLDINPERLVTGLSRAKVVYMPQSTPCGFAHPQSLQLLSRLYRDRIRVRYPNITRDGLVLVHRSGTRRFTHAIAIRAALVSLARETGLVFELYPDLPPPSMEASMRMFAGAAVVVAPHGAGLSNVVYASPGTYVVEAVCNPPHVNMCYQWAAHVLGMHYHALASRGGCEGVIDVDVTAIVDVVRIYAMRAASDLRVNRYS